MTNIGSYFQNVATIAPYMVFGLAVLAVWGLTSIASKR